VKSKTVAIAKGFGEKKLLDIEERPKPVGGLCCSLVLPAPGGMGTPCPSWGCADKRSGRDLTACSPVSASDTQLGEFAACQSLFYNVRKVWPRMSEVLCLKAGCGRAVPPLRQGSELQGSGNNHRHSAPHTPNSLSCCLL